MNDVIKNIAPYLWNYLRGITLIFREPYKTFSERATHLENYKDAVFFMVVSYAICGLFAISAVNRGAPNIEQLLVFLFVFCTSTLISTATIYVAWRIFGYLGPSQKIMTPFLYAVSSYQFWFIVTSIFVVGAVNRTDPLAYSLIMSSLEQIESFSYSEINHVSFWIGYDLRDPSLKLSDYIFYIFTAYMLVNVFLITTVLVGAYRAALGVYSASSEIGNALLVGVSLIAGWTVGYFAVEILAGAFAPISP